MGARQKQIVLYLGGMADQTVLWRAGKAQIESSRIANFRKWVKDRHDISLPDDYEGMWQWSVDDPSLFWMLIWEYFEIGSGEPSAEALTGTMPDCKWFEGQHLNFAEHVFRASNDHYPAILYQSERQPMQTVSWAQLERVVASLQSFLDGLGVGLGDRVGAFIPNIPEATYGFLATTSLGGVWSSCSPDFGADSVIDRFRQIEPKVLIAVDGYQYGGKVFDRMDVVRRIVSEIESIEHVLLIPYLDTSIDISGFDKMVPWSKAIEGNATELKFTPIDFSHPLWVLYSSGTTGVPKAITHSHGGILLEHYKYLAFHNDLHRGEKFFWFSTTGWMMWNYIQGALLHGGTVVLYDGSPGYPDMNVLWQMAADNKLEHFGASAPYLVASMKAGIRPGRSFDLSTLRTVSSTGAPLPPDAFEWVYENVGKEIWLCSMSGGTDVCTAFVGGCIEKPVIVGEIQCRALGCALYAYDDNGEPVIGSLGEMVITKPMPSMPIFFWNDPGKERYRASYFEKYPGIWRHGDWVQLTADGGLVIYGRSDATLNRQGVRIGTAEIYRALHKIDDIKDAIIVHLDNDGRDFMPLFVVLQDDAKLDENLIKQIKTTLRTTYSPRHVPDQVFEIDEVPYTISGKKMEAPVKKILQGGDPATVLNRDAMKNPESMNYFIGIHNS